MRRSIRLTGRRQLPISSFDFQLKEVGGRQVATLAVDTEVSRVFPPEAIVRVKLVENKRVSVLSFGTISSPRFSVDIEEAPFRAPSCEVRIVKWDDPEGLLLGSTSSWTYKTDGAQEGILQFQVDDIAPRLWRLDLRDNEYPLIYVDRQIPDAAAWAGTSPVFGALVLPSVLREIFQKIIEQNRNIRPEGGWMADWIAWAEGMAPGEQMPLDPDEDELGRWCDGLIDTFLKRHGIAAAAISELGK